MDEIRIVLGSLRYKTATNTDLSIPTPLVQNSKNLQEFDRSIDVNLAQVFDDERQKSTTFRPVCKFQILFNNSYTGSTNYPPFENNLYYVNETELTIKQCGLNPDSVYWQGFPQYDEFDFIRSDYSVSGYTLPIPSTTPGGDPMVHVDFVARSASTYNWNHFVSYPYKNIDKVMNFYDENSTTTASLIWNAVDGIPFFVMTMDNNGNDLLEGGNSIIRFKCPVKHGLYQSEYVNIKLSNGYVNTFQVYSFGNGLPGTEEYIFNLFNIGYQSIFNDGDTGTFKRVINNENPNDTTSKYYVIQHKIITDVNDAVLVNAGFEKNIFGITKKFESAVYTPNNEKRVSIKENSQSYSLSFNKDIDINELRDNQKRPISELYITTIWKGYFGLTFGGVDDVGNPVGLKQGFEFNLPPNTQFNTPQFWWEDSNTNSNFVDSNNQPYPIGIYNTPYGTVKLPDGSVLSTINFTYLKSLKSGDTIDGNYCEWNDYEQKERIISEMYHKFTFNSDVFDISLTDDNNNQFGYYYKPNRSMKIRAFSDYIETGSVNNIADVPDYSYFSTTYNSFIWRDLYTYGFKDNLGDGVDYPFLNGKHYPYNNYIFRIIPEGTNYTESTLHNYATLYGSSQPITDNCE
jgi:hypothetical protein